MISVSSMHDEDTRAMFTIMIARYRKALEAEKNYYDILAD